MLDLLEWLIDWWVYGRQSSPPFFCFAKLLRHWHFLRREHEVYWHARPNFCWRSFLWASGQPGKQPCVRMCWSDPNGKKSLEPEFCKVPNEKFKHFGESISKHELWSGQEHVIWCFLDLFGQHAGHNWKKICTLFEGQALWLFHLDVKDYFELSIISFLCSAMQANCNM